MLEVQDKKRWKVCYSDLETGGRTSNERNLNLLPSTRDISSKHHAILYSQTLMSQNDSKE